MSAHYLDKPGDPEFEAGERALDWALARGSGERVAARSQSQRLRKQRRRRIAMGGLSAAMIIAIGMLWMPDPVSEPAVLAESPASIAIFSPVTKTLPDGSVIELRDGAEVEVDYRPDARHVVLLTGEAHFFVVTKDDFVPFIVTVSGIEIRAVGTAFLVQSGDSQVGILVTEGSVTVDQPVKNSPDSESYASISRTLVTVEAGKRVVVDVTAGSLIRLEAVSPTEQNQILAWRVPRIELSGTPLVETLAVFNRHSPVRLSLADPDLGNVALSGVLRPDNPNALLHVLKVEFGIVGDEVSEGQIVLRRP